MTVTANKHGLKAAAATRTKKHAQRTPLPPRAGVVAEALAEVAPAAPAPKTPRPRKSATPAPVAAENSKPAKETKPAKFTTRKCDQKSAHAAHEYFHPQKGFYRCAGQHPTDDTTQEELKALIPKPARKRAAQKAPAEAPVATPAAPPADPTAGDTKAHRNAGAFAEAGWDVTVTVDGDFAELVAVRGQEIIHQAWMKGLYHNESSTYTIADRTVHLRNVAEAKRWAARSVAEAGAQLQKVAANKSFVRRAPTALVRAALPFDPLTVPEDELLKHLSGKTIRWHNRLSNTEEDATLSTLPRYFSLTEYAGFRILQFCCVSSGFRALKMENFLGFGKAKRASVAVEAEAA